MGMKWHTMESASPSFLRPTTATRWEIREPSFYLARTWFQSTLNSKLFLIQTLDQWHMLPEWECLVYDLKQRDGHEPQSAGVSCLRKNHDVLRELVSCTLEFN
mmetsp:Transcript_18332/g.23087  ORF Transcript_18332/g.23087 Transcript_18332/m.23087 type:complete len:103 (+) Transcript_18332:670-978(+)